MSNTVTLAGKDYKLVWGNLARIRYTGLPDTVRTAGGLVPLASMLWCAIAAKPNPFPSWEDLADVLDADNIPAVEAALVAVLPKVEEAEKKSTISEPSPV